MAVRHRNHLDIISSSRITANTDGVFVYDFTANETTAFGPQQQKIIGGRAVMHSREFNGDGIIQTSDYDAWILNPALINVYQNTDAK